ncbi:hypothetical protein BK120_08795 [Paenibacillus sp. FSL A5-0031]|uniref:Cap15 family cyclic dinucleotide receptor domain-containing protein n=1 Tax=Paenibacillus sp. FSL A5-0031 TaxID=1920420 RepID=UPI00096F3DDB|nr:hypothetical protein [Paenibacillus sp. FSL A5-0031]OME86078.1 hypothetical protein BK120_08795 [Paenibacillus sp. FSL A5-0031]
MDIQMLNKTMKISAYLTIFIFLVFYFVEGNEFNFMHTSGKVVTCVTVFWLVFFNIGWKIKWLDKIFNIPNLNGTWIGTLESDWKNEDGNSVQPLEFYIVIKQKFININIKTFTESYVGKSYIEKLDCNERSDEINLVYLYCSDINSEEEDKRQGATELRLLQGQTCLKGKYWTRNKTCGTISLQFYNKKHLTTFEEIKNQIRVD